MSERTRNDELRSARLLLGADAPAGLLDGTVSGPPALKAAVRSRPWPPAPVRFVARVRRKLGGLDYERSVAEPLNAARRAALGAGAAAPPRFLVRVDEFPHYQAWDDPERYGTDAYGRFHATMAGAGVPYLIAVLPRVSAAALDPRESRWRPLVDDERALLGTLAGDAVAFGLHGLDHRTRFASPRRHSELCGLDERATEALLDAGLAELTAVGIAPQVFVAPYNRFDADQYDVLARRFAVVCGGPETVSLLGFQRTPVWRGQAVYLPSYFPLYGRAQEILPAARRLVERRIGVWAPIVLHWGWEAQDDYAALARLLDVIAPHAAHWEQFLEAVRESGGDDLLDK